MTHTCDVCGGTGEWRKGWQYYGAIADLDECIPVFKTCSTRCRAKVEDPDKALDELRIRRLGYRIVRRGCTVKKVRL